MGDPVEVQVAFEVLPIAVALGEEIADDLRRAGEARSRIADDVGALLSFGWGVFLGGSRLFRFLLPGHSLDLAQMHSVSVDAWRQVVRPPGNTRIAFARSAADIASWCSTCAGAVTVARCTARRTA